MTSFDVFCQPNANNWVYKITEEERLIKITNTRWIEQVNSESKIVEIYCKSQERLEFLINGDYSNSEKPDAVPSTIMKQKTSKYFKPIVVNNIKILLKGRDISTYVLNIYIHQKNKEEEEIIFVIDYNFYSRIILKSVVYHCKESFCIQTGTNGLEYANPLSHGNNETKEQDIDKNDFQSGIGFELEEDEEEEKNVIYYDNEEPIPMQDENDDRLKNANNLNNEQEEVKEVHYEKKDLMPDDFWEKADQI